MQLGSVCRCSPIFMRCRVLPSRLQLRGCRGLIGGPDFGCRTSTGSRMIHSVVDEFVRHFRFAPALWPRLREAMSPAWVRSLTNPASYSAIRANMPKTSLPWAVVVSTIPLVSDCTPTPRPSRVVTMSMRSRRFRPSRSIFQMIRVSPGRRSSRQRIHWGRAALVPVAVFLVDLQAAGGLERAAWSGSSSRVIETVPDPLPHAGPQAGTRLRAGAVPGREWREPLPPCTGFAVTR